MTNIEKQIKKLSQQSSARITGFLNLLITKPIITLIPSPEFTIKLIVTSMLILTHFHTYTLSRGYTQAYIHIHTFLQSQSYLYSYIYLDSVLKFKMVLQLALSLRLTLKFILILTDICDHIHIYLPTVTRIYLENHPHIYIHIPNHTQAGTHIQIYIYTYVYDHTVTRIHNQIHTPTHGRSPTMSYSYSYPRKDSRSHLLIFTFLPTKLLSFCHLNTTKIHFLTQTITQTHTYPQQSYSCS